MSIYFGVSFSWHFLNPLTCRFHLARFDYRTRQNHGARHVSTVQFLSELTFLHYEDGTERGSILTLPSDLIPRNILILFGSHWEYLTHLKYLLMFFFSSQFPYIPHNEAAWEWGDAASGSRQHVLLCPLLSASSSVHASINIPWSEQGVYDAEILTMSEYSMLAWSNSSIFHIYVTLWK